MLVLQGNYPALEAESLPSSCYNAFGGHITAPARMDLDGQGEWHSVEYSCDSSGVLSWADWTNTSTVSLLGLDASYAPGGAMHGTKEYYNELGAVSDVQIRGVLYHPDLNRFVTVDSMALFQESGELMIIRMFGRSASLLGGPRCGVGAAAVIVVRRVASVCFSSTDEFLTSCPAACNAIQVLSTCCPAQTRRSSKAVSHRRWSLSSSSCW